MSRWDMHRFARRAYDMGIRYIGGCCKIQSYHIRAIAEELHEERGKLPASHDKHDMWGGGLMLHTKPWVRARANKEYWVNLKPASGRPFCPSLSKPDQWGITQGDQDLQQHQEATSQEEVTAITSKYKN